MALRIIAVLSLVLATASSFAAVQGEFLVRFSDDDSRARASFVDENGGSLTLVSKEGKLFKWTSPSGARPTWGRDSGVVYAQPNFTISLLSNPSIEENRAALAKAIEGKSFPIPRADKPAINDPAIESLGADPLLGQAWGMALTGANVAWPKTNQGKGIVVAVTDTGVDYNHGDLINNMWRNPKEIPNNGIDDDNNGFIDDVVGWDFVLNDNKPFDITKSLIEILFKGGNPGHGTHVAGVVAARMNNSQGTAGVAPQAAIMALRFISEEGKGTTEAAIKSIDYAVNNGAHIINASWGGEAGDEDDSALKEAIKRAEAKGVIFVAAAGNGRLSGMEAKGFDNDTDKKPMVPASWLFPNIVSVSAIDSAENLAKFSNWGFKSTKIGAPGVKILSTVPGNKYQDTVVDFAGIKATWDGTSMAAPFVAGALAVIWSQDTGQSWEKVRDTLLSNAVPIAALKGKVATQGRMDLRALGN